MATVTENDKAGGNFGSDLIWDTKHHPVAGDIANITNTFAGADYTVGVTDAQAAARVNIGAANVDFAVEGGILTVGSIDLTAGTLSVVGAGEITGHTTITDGSNANTRFVDGTLDGVTWKGTLALNGVTQSSLLTITGSLDVLDAAGSAAGEIDITGPGAAVNFESTMTLNGSGGKNLLINIGTSSASLEFLSVGSGDILTLGSLVTVSQTAAGSNVRLDDVSVQGTIINNGTMSFAAGAGSSSIVNPDRFVNNGTVQVDGGLLNGESLDISAQTSFSNTGLISLVDFGRVGISASIAPGAMNVDGVISATGTSTIDLNTNATGAGVITLANVSTADILNYTGTVAFLDGTDTLALEQPGSYTGTIAGMSGVPGGTHDVVDLLHTNVTSIAPYVGTALGGVLTVMNGADIAAALTLVGDYRDVQFNFASDNNAGANVFIGCFARGTRLDTPNGPISVEALRAGDVVLTANGPSRAVRWMGHRRIDLKRHPNPAAVRPIRVLAHAFGPDRPRRDVLLSPDHAVFVDGVLIPIKYLINGVTIWQQSMAEVIYYHVELDWHDVLLAEGLPAESYLDTGDRCHFDGERAVIALHPGFSAQRWEAAGCAALIVTGPALQAVRRRLSDIAATSLVEHAAVRAG